MVSWEKLRAGSLVEDALLCSLLLFPFIYVSYLEFMSGHSKWSKIKRKKGANDASRGKLFTRIIHEITVAVREGGGGDPDANPRLRLAVDKARGANMPKDAVERAIRRGTGEDKAGDMMELTYEGYGPGGAAVLIEVVTDNKNRTVSELRHAFSRCGGNLGENGCVGYLFKKKGLFEIEKSAIAEDQLMELALEAGADDVVDETESWEVICDFQQFNQLQAAFDGKVEFLEAGVQMLPSTRISLAGKECEQMIRLIEMLEDLDDVVNVYFNCDFEQ